MDANKLKFKLKEKETELGFIEGKTKYIRASDVYAIIDEQAHKDN